MVIYLSLYFSITVEYNILPFSVTLALVMYLFFTHSVLFCVIITSLLSSLPYFQTNATSGKHYASLVIPTYEQTDQPARNNLRVRNTVIAQQFGQKFLLCSENSVYVFQAIRRFWTRMVYVFQHLCCSLHSENTWDFFLLFGWSQSPQKIDLDGSLCRTFDSANLYVPSR